MDFKERNLRFSQRQRMLGRLKNPTAYQRIGGKRNLLLRIKDRLINRHSKRNRELEYILKDVIRSYDDCSGYEPSVSVLGVAISEAKEYLNIPENNNK